MEVSERENGFYRATLCVSVVFALGRSPSVCLSVRLSVTFVYCIHRAEDIVKLLSWPISPIILVFFDTVRRYSIPTEPLLWGAKIWVWGKIHDFRPKLPFISETVRDRRIVAMER